MAKTQTIFVCENCGAQFPKWSGQCFECGKWGTLGEQLTVGNPASPAGREQSKKAAEILRVTDVTTDNIERMKTDIGEIDRVLGGGIVPASVVLFAGEPGIGKSTLLTQIALNLSQPPTVNDQKCQFKNQNLKIKITDKKSNILTATRKPERSSVQGKPRTDFQSGAGANSYKLKAFSVFYVCGEESPNQVKMRIKRLSENGNGKNFDNIFLYPETNVDQIILNVKSEMLPARNRFPTLRDAGGKLNVKSKDLKRNKELPTSNFQPPTFVLIVDSIQTLITEDLSGIAGSIGQVRECTHRLINFAKETQTPVFLVGHITKEGQLAGPKTIEHSVDTVLYFEGERTADLRLLRSVKNRFGPTDEVGVFQMTEKGLIEIKDPSFLSGDKSFAPKVGSSYTVVFEGTRPLVAEIQALVVKSFSPIPKRVVNGLEKNRSEMLLAVLQKYLRLPLWSYDVFLNVGAGLKVKDPASDLAVCAAVTSSFKNKTFVASSVFCGEVSLLGEVKEVSRMEKRVKQARSLGFKNIVFGKNLKRVEELKRIVNS